MAGYHAWAFERLYAALVPLDDAAYRDDCGLFFRSIHGTLNHLLLADRVWFARFQGERYEVAGLDSELEGDRVLLEHALADQAPRWAAWIAAADDATLAATLDYTNLAGTVFSNPLAAVLLHVFNHATHHRGQISAALTTRGLAAPELDLIAYLRGVGAPLPAV
ncbi:MAG: DinB family protein [Gammaproteobacteria bacterium]|nr:DinB family protein [Gammaproteobacteria bacterium]MCP5201572.1 DinB family protein [Gammaproteobacteria bacterium]